MTSLGKAIITAGIVIFTLSALMWIIRDNAQWFAGGAAIFAGCILSGIVLSVETKNKTTNGGGGSRPHYEYVPNSEVEVVRPQQQQENDWQQPSTPPPDDEQDPFSRPPNVTV